jgi:hypothetical protein
VCGCVSVWVCEEKREARKGDGVPAAPKENDECPRESAKARQPASRGLFTIGLRRGGDAVALPADAPTPLAFTIGLRRGGDAVALPNNALTPVAFISGRRPTR